MTLSIGDQVIPTQGAWVRFLTYLPEGEEGRYDRFAPPTLRVEALGSKTGNPNLEEYYMMEGIPYWWCGVELQASPV